MNLWEQLTKLMLEMEKRRFGNLEPDDAFRIEACNLTAQFGADGTGRSCHQHHLVLSFSTNQICLQLGGCATQEIFDCHVSNLSCEAASLNDFREGWYRLKTDLCRCTMSED